MSLSWSLTAIFVDPNKAGADALRTALESRLAFAAIDVVPSTAKALDACFDQPYDVCFLSEKLPQEALQIFLNDVRKIGHAKHCCFVQVRKLIDSSMDRSSLGRSGIATIISSGFDELDQAALTKALTHFIRTKEVEGRGMDIEENMAGLLRGLDLAADAARRGRNDGPRNVQAELMNMNAGFDAALLERYFEALTESTAEAAPETTLRLEVPAKVLKKSLPKLSKDRYAGASSRVSQRLKKKFGVKKDEGSK